jgi:hypothetical protein
MDDTMFTPAWSQPYTFGPTRAWQESLDAGEVEESERHDFRVGMGMCLGRYAI